MAKGGLIVVDEIEYYRIDGVEEMAPFLMSVVSETDLWMFVSSTGALTAGRVDPDHALFPYETDDRLHRAAAITGPVTVIARSVAGVRQVWQPFGRQLADGSSRSLAKSALGNRLLFESHNPDWSLTYRATWAPSDEHGWVRTVELIDGRADAGGQAIDYDVLDGLLDVMPAGVDAHTEQIRSNLVDAYKRSELGPWGRLAVYSLEALISDRPEPAEALTANVVWSYGFDDAHVDLDDRAVNDMLADRARPSSSLVTGRPGAYLLRGPVSLSASGSVTWSIVAEAGLDHPAVLRTTRVASTPQISERVADDIDAGSDRLRALLALADGFQTTADAVADAHHLSNVLYNSMRGGVFPYGHKVPADDFGDFVKSRNRDVWNRRQAWIEQLGEWVDVAELRAAAVATGDADLLRLVLEYLPLTFSRRHGDPSRPWNRFSINVHAEDGGELLAYEGNWRDIFQNWEALLQSYPSYFPHVVGKFVNASTMDGHNPYRISRDGIDWEVPEPNDPWSHIGYWGDHQLVYLLRLLESWKQHRPGELLQWLDQQVFVFADVPYAIADHADIVDDPKNTITYDERQAAEIADREANIGADGRLVVDSAGSLVHVGLLEKLLVPALASLSNMVPDGGIWLNTQRPEWNDANNALAGPGLSMVTLCYLRRYLDFVHSLVDGSGVDAVPMSATSVHWLADVVAVLERLPLTPEPLDDQQRRALIDELGACRDAHRDRVNTGVEFDTVDGSVADVVRLCVVAGAYLDRSIRAAQRLDGLYHSYNRLSFPTDDAAHVDHLGLMLEGQVAVLSSGALDAEGALAVIDALFASAMYRADQDSFLLYPVVELQSFVERNVVPPEVAAQLLLMGGLDGPLGRVVSGDEAGGLHFNPEIVNANVLGDMLEPTSLTPSDRALITEVYEVVFAHDSFTGRSGSMYGYEGIGSIYWHMVAKLLLAVQETYWAAIDVGEPPEVVARLAVAYRHIRSGLGFQKDPDVFGAIPTDCYSHTPGHAGAQQPGMTGQVKEEVLTRFGELGFRVIDGCVTVAPGLLPPAEMFPLGADGRIEPARLSLCATPMTIAEGPTDSVCVVRHDGSRELAPGRVLSTVHSAELFGRFGTIAQIDWTVTPAA